MVKSSGINLTKPAGVCHAQFPSKASEKYGQSSITDFRVVYKEVLISFILLVTVCLERDTDWNSLIILSSLKNSVILREYCLTISPSMNGEI